MAFKEINVTSFDHDVLKQELIQYLEASGKFDDFDFEGSAINTIIDLLVRNSEHDAFLANMLANESFLQSAQIRGNVASHAQKLSYIPRTITAARAIADIEVTPTDTQNIPNSIVMDKGTVFLSSIGGETYTFTNKQDYTLTFNANRGTYKVSDVDLYQGQLVTNTFTHVPNTKITIPNPNCDSSTLVVSSSEDLGQVVGKVYQLADDINQLSSDSFVFFLSENLSGRTRFEFGKGVLGNEPPENTTITAEYIAAEVDHANGASVLTAASTISGYSNISVTVTTQAYGGSAREDIESIRFIAPKYYEIQNRALADVDYAILLKANFPFIKSAISWGGETNEPAMYGNVLVSIISEEGGLVTNTVKQQMVSFLSSKNVGSVTPVIVEPEYFGIDLTVGFAYDPRLTSKTFNGLSSDVNSAVVTYGNTLNEFDVYYNEPLLIRDILAISGVSTVNIEKLVFKEINVLRFSNPVYTIDFDNEIEKGSVLMEDFQIASNGINHKLYDDDGIIYVDYTISGEVTTTQVGTVDYENGVVDFTLNMVQSANTVKLYVKPVEENFYVQGNRVVFVNDITTELVDERLRNGKIN